MSIKDKVHIEQSLSQYMNTSEEDFVTATAKESVINPLTADPVKALQFAMLV